MEEVHEVLENSTCAQLNDSFKDNDNGQDHYKQYVSEMETESFFDELVDRMTVSRMVNESVIKGIVKAVSEEANEVILAKDAEITNLHEELRSREFELSRLKHILQDKRVENGYLEETISSKNRQTKDFLHLFSRRGACLSEMNGDAWSLGIEAEEQWQRVMREIEDVRMLALCNSMDHSNLNTCNIANKSNSSSDPGHAFVAERRPHSLDEADIGSRLRKILNKVVKIEEGLASLKDVLDEVFKQICSDLFITKSTSVDCQWMWELQEAITAIVMQGFIQNIQEHSEEELQKMQVINTQHDVWLSHMEAISNLHQELENISQYLFISESGNILLHGSHEGHDRTNGPKGIQRRALGDHTSFGHQEQSITIVSSAKSVDSISIPSETLESAHLNHMNRDELIVHFKTEILKMKRNHESQMHEATEDYFQLKRQLLKDKGSVHARKDKDLEGVKKRISEVISTLDNIMKQNSNFSLIFDNYKRIHGMMNKMTKENQNLKNVLGDKKKEIQFLSSQVTDAIQKLSLQSAAEINLLKQVKKFKSDLKECEMESFIKNEICVTVFKEFILGHECEVSDSNFEAVIMHELSKIILEEAVKDADAIMKSTMIKYHEATKLSCKFESLAKEKERAMCIEMKEKEQLKGEVMSLSALLMEKEKLELEANSSLVRQKEELKIVSDAYGELRHQTIQLERILMDKNHELEAISWSLKLALQQVDKYKNDSEGLEQRLKIALNDLHTVHEQKTSLERVVQEKQQIACMFLEKEREQKEQWEVVCKLVMDCSREMEEFEHKVADNMSLNNLRFGMLNDALCSLIQRGCLLRKRGLWCKKIYSDLQKAEAEVDILGDEVDSLLNLLEKIYFALDHYSPVLKYYPGIMEILKLVKRELSGEKSTASSGIST